MCTSTVLGGLLADPVNVFPRIFGQAGIFESQWLYQYPYALPNLINAVLLTISTVIIYLFLEEVSSLRPRMEGYILKLTPAIDVGASQKTL